MMSKIRGAVLVLSGPSGAGKSSLIHKIIDDLGECYFSISTTTREKREGEVDGVDYHFVDKKEFEQEIENDQFLEYAVVHGNYYGTSVRPVKKALEEGKLVIFDIDVQGNSAVCNRLGDITTSVFITPPTLSELKRRLQNRLTDTQEVIKKRIEMARKEIQRAGEYEYLLINDNLEEAAEKLRFIAKTARFKKSNDAINLFISEWEDI